MSRAVHPSLACWPGLTHGEAAELALAGVTEPELGTLDASLLQIVPQGRDVFDVAKASAFRWHWPQVQFRLHANVRVMPERRVVDLVDFRRNRDWFEQLAQVHTALSADVYSAHAGRRSQGTADDVFDAARRCADLFNAPVAIEGHYPDVASAAPGGSTRRDVDTYLFSTWAEYADLLACRLPFVIDLSHLNIVAVQTGKLELGLVRELLASEACLEVHLSDNDGRRDLHTICTAPTWWSGLLDDVHAGAELFSEGNHLRHERRAA